MGNETEQSTKFPSSPPPTGSSPLSAFPPEVRPRQHTISPHDLDQLTESYAARPIENGFSPEKSIQGIIYDLEEWANSIARRSRIETIRSWIFKGLAFFGAVATAAGGALAMPRISIAFGVVTAIFIAVDAAWPASGDRNARRRAIHELRELQHTLNLKWEKVRLAHPDPSAIKRVAHALALLDSAQGKREQIEAYLGEASPTVRSLSESP